MTKHHITGLLLLLIIAIVIISGCTNPGSTTSDARVTSTQIGTNIPTPITTASTPAITSPENLTDSQKGVVKPRGVADPAFVVDVLIPEKIAPGTTLLTDLHDLTRPRIVEVNALGEMVWEYDVPSSLINYVNPGLSAVPLHNGNILIAFPLNGVYELNRTTKDVVWKFLDPKVSHDAQRLGNGNTLVVDGGYFNETINDAQVREINPQGEVVWSWFAKEHGFNQEPYLSISDFGWSHTNAADRLENGNTLISMRNFNLTVEVDRNGTVVRTIGKGVMVQQHDPEIEQNGNILFANADLLEAIEIDPSGNIVWNYTVSKDTGFSDPTRDADRLQNQYLANSPSLFPNPTSFQV